MDNQTGIPLYGLVQCVAEASDLVSPYLSGHHDQVAYLACGIAQEALVPSERIDDIALAALVHDIGASSLAQRLADLQFGGNTPGEHAEAGWLLLKDCEPLRKAAPLVRFHHVNWVDGQAETGDEVPPGSHVLHLAERVGSLIAKDRPVPEQLEAIAGRIQAESGKMFDPALVEAFLNFARKEDFWTPFASSSVSVAQLPGRQGKGKEVDSDSLISLARLFSKIVDFRSSFTATHSSGVAACAEALARAAGWSVEDCTLMRVAGFLHDLGKLGVPAEMLDKPGPLSEEESAVVKLHAFHTFRILNKIQALELIKCWASFHHVRNDGSGYPAHIDASSLPLACRMMAVADTFTALTEDRPHRRAMKGQEALAGVRRMADKGELDSTVVDLMESNFDDIHFFIQAARAVAAFEYAEFKDWLLSPGRRT